MEELVIDKKKYISSRRAARVSGYTKDYIGQLCRAGLLPSRIVGRSWYVDENSLKNYQKTYRGEPVVDRDALYHEVTDSGILSLREVADQYVNKQEQERKEKLLDELFDFKYEKESGPLMPEPSRAYSVPTSKREVALETDDEAGSSSESLSSNLDEETLDEESTQEGLSAHEYSVPLYYDLSTPKTRAVGPSVKESEVPDDPIPHSRFDGILNQPKGDMEGDMPLPNGVEQNRGKGRLVYLALFVLAFLMFSSSFVGREDTYERRIDGYVRSETGVVVAGMDGVIQEASKLLASALAYLD